MQTASGSGDKKRQEGAFFDFLKSFLEIPIIEKAVQSINDAP